MTISNKQPTFVKPSHVTGFVVHQQLEPSSPSLQLFRLYAGIRHLHFVFSTEDGHQFDRLRLPWHFIDKIRKSRRSSHKLYIHLCKSAFESLKSTMPEKYFPNVQQIIVLKMCSHRERNDFIKGLMKDGLVLKKDHFRGKCYIPQTLDYKWKHCYIPERFDQDDQDKLLNLNIGEHYLRDLEQIHRHTPESSNTLDYTVPDESKKRNYPRITFEQSLDAHQIGQLESNCKGHGDKKNCEKPCLGEQVKFTLRNACLRKAVRQLVPRAMRKMKVRLL